MRQRNGLPHFRLHDCRHTFGTDYYAATGDLKATSESLGHSSVQIKASTYVFAPDEVK